MKSKLLPRFLIIIFVAIVATWIALTVPVNKGIDLAGGTSLVYELDLDKVQASSNESRLQMAQRVVDVLKKRVDPLGQKNIIWRVLEQGKRIQIQMPFPPQSTRDAKTAEDEAFKALQGVAWKESELRDAAKEKEPARAEGLAKFAPKDSAEYKLLQELAQASDALTKADADLEGFKAGGTQTEESLLAARHDALVKYEGLVSDAMAKSVKVDDLKLEVRESDDPDNTAARDSLPKYGERYPLQKKQIDAYLEAHKKVVELSGGGVTDTAELKRLVTKSGVLDFRIAVTRGEISSDEYAEAVRSLDQKGLEQQVEVKGIKTRWFLIDPKGVDNLTRSDCVTVTPSKQSYILCYDEHDRTLTHSDPKRDPWSVTANNPYTDPSSGGLQLPFRLDPKGAGYMGDMTLAWKEHPMAILLDDRDERPEYSFADHRLGRDHLRQQERIGTEGSHRTEVDYGRRLASHHAPRRTDLRRNDLLRHGRG